MASPVPSLLGTHLNASAWNGGKKTGSGYALCRALDPQGSGTGGLFTSEWAAGVHAKLLVKDFDWMLVSSCNFLNAPRERTALELGVRVCHPPPNPGNENRTDAWTQASRVTGPLPATLMWARSVVPDFAVRRTMLVDPVFGGVAGPPPPVEIQGELKAPETDLARRFWPDWWAQRVERLRQYLARAGTYVVPVFDVDHRALMFEAIESARRRLVISSDKLGVGLLGRVPYDAALAALRRGVKVTVVFAQVAPGIDFPPRRAELERMGAEFVQRDVHAKALVADDRVCLSSFNFLSFEGIGKAGFPRRELGVRVFQRGFADQVVDVLTSAR